MPILKTRARGVVILIKTLKNCSPNSTIFSTFKPKIKNKNRFKSYAIFYQRKENSGISNRTRLSFYFHQLFSKDALFVMKITSVGYSKPLPNGNCGIIQAPHSHGIARRMSLTQDHRPRRSLQKPTRGWL